jgi:hypothetical protein
MANVSGRILLAGYAKLPSNTAAQKMFDQMVVVADVDFESGIVLEVDCAMATDLARRFVQTMMKGYNLNTGIDNLLEEINLKYYGHLKRALLTAVREIGQQYADLKKENS